MKNFKSINKILFIILSVALISVLLMACSEEVPSIGDEQSSELDFTEDTTVIEPEVTEPDATEPEVSEPEITEPIPETTVPETTVTEDIGTTDVYTTAPESSETESTESNETESGETESGETESVETESVETESVETESVETESVETESVETESTETDSDSTEETEPVELTFIYSPNEDPSTCTLNTVLGAPNEFEIPAEIDGLTVTAISANAFEFADNITKITIPAGITKIGNSAFYPCDELREVHITDINAWMNIDFENYTANPLYHAKKLFVNNKRLSSLTIPEGITEIKPYTFYNCNTITKIVLPSTLSKIGASAFNGSRISEVYVTSIKDWLEISFASISANPITTAAKLFVDGVETTSVVIPDDITEIPAYSFYNFDGIIQLDIHSAVTKIGSSAFSGCNYLETVVIHDVAAWCSINFVNDAANPMVSAKHFAISDGENITDLSVIEIPASVTKISPYAFYNCTEISEVQFAEGSQLTTIGTAAFKNCSNLETIYLPDSIEVIENSAFSLCMNLAYFESGAGNYLGNLQNPHLALISIDNDNSSENAENTITSFDIPQKTKIIYQAAFYSCTKLESIILHDSIIYLGNSAFFNCTSLKTVAISGNITSIGNSTFAQCSSLESVTIPSSVTTIGRSAFAYCSNLSSLTLSQNLTHIDQYAFRDCVKLNNVVIPSTVTTIGSGAFANCKALKSVTFSDENGWNAGTVAIPSTDLQSASVAAYYLTTDYYVQEWQKK